MMHQADTPRRRRRIIAFALILLACVLVIALLVTSMRRALEDSARANRARDALLMRVVPSVEQRSSAIWNTCARLWCWSVTDANIVL